MLAGQRSDFAGGLLWKLGLFGFVASAMLTLARAFSNYRFRRETRKGLKRKRK